MTDVVDTLEITGGRALASVDAVAVREAASNAGHGSERLRAASFRVGQAVRALENLALTPGLTPTWPDPSPDRASFCDAGSAVRHRMIADDARALASRLVACADESALLRDRLLRAAGLYEQGESAVEKVFGGAVQATFAGGTYLVSVTMPALVESIGRAWVAGTVPLAAAYVDGKAASDGSPGDGSTAPASDHDAHDEAGSGVWPVVVAGIGPWSDEAVAGLGFGIAAAHPLNSRFDFSVTGAARTLSGLAHTLLPRTTARVREVRPADLAPDESTPTGTIVSAFTKIEGLYGRGPHGEALDVPPATISVERVTHADGTTAWVVLIPGTQSTVSATNPFDGLTDIDIMAHETAETATAVQAVLDAAGATPDQSVVLVGHSLGGITAVALAASPSFRQKHRVGGVVTAGSPTASFTTPPDVPVLHVENDEELVSNLDGLSGQENPSGPNRVTVTRSLAASSNPLDQMAAGSIGDGHGTPTHQRTVAAAIESGNAQVMGVVEPIEALMAGTSSQTQYYSAQRVVEPRPPAPEPTPSPGPSPSPASSVAPRDPLGQTLGKLPGVGPVIARLPGLGGPPLTLTGAPLPTAVPVSPGGTSSGSAG